MSIEGLTLDPILEKPLFLLQDALNNGLCDTESGINASQRLQEIFIDDNNSVIIVQSALKELSKYREEQTLYSHGELLIDQLHKLNKKDAANSISKYYSELNNIVNLEMLVSLGMSNNPEEDLLLICEARQDAMYQTRTVETALNNLQSRIQGNRLNSVTARVNDSLSVMLGLVSGMFGGFLGQEIHIEAFKSIEFTGITLSLLGTAAFFKSELANLFTSSKEHSGGTIHDIADMLTGDSHKKTTFEKFIEKFALVSEQVTPEDVVDLLSDFQIKNDATEGQRIIFNELKNTIKALQQYDVTSPNYSPTIKRAIEMSILVGGNILGNLLFGMYSA